jgi:predicted transcriptional regulator of viral defense system
LTEIDYAIGRLAADQHGIITRTQALALGLSSATIARRRASGRWIAVEAGVYRIRGAPDTWLSRLMALCLAYGGIASHRTAAHLHGVNSFGPAVIEISVPRGRAVQRRGVIMHECTDLHLSGPELIQGIPTTSLARLVVDIGSVIRFERYEQALTN